MSDEPIVDSMLISPYGGWDDMPENQRRSCEVCGSLIPKRRLELLPDTFRCVSCSDVEAKTVRDLDDDRAMEELIDATQQQDSSAEW